MEIYFADPTATTLQGIKGRGLAAHRDLGMKVRTITKEIPEIIEHIREIPGRSEPLDYTEFTGKVNYSRGTLTILADVTENSAEYINGAIINRLHGKLFNVLIDEDEKHYYTGRCTITPIKDNDIITGYEVKIRHNPFRHIIPSIASQFTNIATGQTSESATYWANIYIGEHTGDINLTATFITPSPTSSTQVIVIFKKGTDTKYYYAKSFPFVISDLPYSGDMQIGLRNAAVFSLTADNKEL